MCHWFIPSVGLIYKNNNNITGTRLLKLSTRVERQEKREETDQTGCCFAYVPRYLLEILKTTGRLILYARGNKNSITFYIGEVSIPVDIQSPTQKFPHVAVLGSSCSLEDLHWLWLSRLATLFFIIYWTGELIFSVLFRYIIVINTLWHLARRRIVLVGHI